jgi:hypothetical protein
VDYYKITIPSGAASKMTIKMQSAGLSLLAPKLALYSSSGNLLTSTSGTVYNTTVSF